MQTSDTRYDKRNDAVRIDTHSELDHFVGSAVRAFFRHLNAAHLFEERIIPALQSEDAMLFVAVRERPWPPWGLGAVRVAAVAQVQSIGNRNYGFGPMYMAAEDSANIGLRAAFYKEILEHVTRQAKADVNYLVVDGSFLADHVLRGIGFARTEDKVLTEEAEYHFYRADAHDLLNKLNLANISVPELLAHKMGEDVLTANVLFHGMLELAAQQSWRFEHAVSEIIPIDGSLLHASLPGGVGPVGPAKE